MPQITEQTPRSDIKIQDIIFSCPRPYAEGMTLTAGEAQALNQTFAENIRNNTAALVKQRNDLQEKLDKGEEINGGKVMTDDELIAEFEKYAVDYQFGVRSARGVTVSANPVEREARRIAMAQIKEVLKTKNIKISSVGDEKMEQLVTQLAAKEATMAEARRRVESIKEISLDELDLSGEPKVDTPPPAQPTAPPPQPQQPQAGPRA